MATTIAQIGGFELWDILQLAQTSRMSIKLSVESPYGTGSMFFEHGHLLHAEAENKVGDEAVSVMLGWREGSVSSSKLPDNTPTTVRNSSISALLLEHARRSDESERDAERERKRAAQQQRKARRSQPPPAPPPAPPPRATRRRPQPQPPQPQPQPEPQSPPPQEEDSPMDLQAVKSILEEIDESLMGGLLGVDIISRSTSMSIAGINSSRHACALFNRMYEDLQTAMASKESPAKQLHKLIIEGENNTYIFIIEIDKRHRWAMLVDGNRAALGMVLAIVIPDFQPKLVDALKHYS